MAEDVGLKLVENDQKRILQQLFDSVTSNLYLDVPDFKESDNHKLLHLVWRKFTRNRCPTDGQKTIIPPFDADQSRFKTGPIQNFKKFLHF